MADSFTISKEEVDKIFDTFTSIESDKTGWTDVTEKLEVKVSSKYIGDNGIAILKGVAVIKVPPKNVKDFLWAVDTRGKWDTFFESGKLIREIEAGKLGLAYYKTKSSMTVWPRDFGAVVAAREEADGGYLCVAKSVDSEVVFPLDSSCVRAKILISGFKIEPVGEGASKVTYMFQVDGGGWVPTSVVNLVNNYQPLGLIGIRKQLTGKSQP